MDDESFTNMSRASGRSDRVKEKADKSGKAGPEKYRPSERECDAVEKLALKGGDCCEQEKWYGTCLNVTNS